MYILEQWHEAIWHARHHKPGFPDQTVFEGSEAECIAWAKGFKAQPAFEMLDFYHVGADRIWRPIEA